MDEDLRRHADLAELALGAAGGHERAEALRHVTGCGACRLELTELSKVADSLLLLAPEIEPPAGFESTVVGRVKPGRVKPGRRWLTLAAAIVVAASLGAGAAWTAAWRATGPDRRLAGQTRQTLEIANGSYLRAVALITEAGSQAGAVFFYEGSPSWLLISVDAALADGPYEVRLTNRDGRTYPSIGICEVRGGAGTTAYQIRAPLDNIASIMMTGPDGTRLIAHA